MAKKRTSSTQNSREWTELKDSVRFFTVRTVSGFVDGIYFVIWVLVQWAVDKFVVTPLILTGVDRIVMVALQILFGISTFVPIAITVYSDIYIMWVRANRKIRNEIRIGDHDETN